MGPLRRRKHEGVLLKAFGPGAKTINLSDFIFLTLFLIKIKEKKIVFTVPTC